MTNCRKFSLHYIIVVARTASQTKRMTLKEKFSWSTSFIFVNLGRIQQKTIKLFIYTTYQDNKW